MNARSRYVSLAVLGILAAAGIAGVVIASLYRTGIAREGASLRHMVESQAALSEALFASELGTSAGDTAVAMRETLGHLRDALTGLSGMGGFGGMSVSRRVGDALVVEVGIGADTLIRGDTVPLPSERMTVAQRAIAGASGLIRGEPDHRGVRVLAAYAPVRGAGLGIVVKLDWEAAREPYRRAAAVAGGLALLLLAAAVGVGRSLGAPLLSEVEEREAAHRTLLRHFPGIAFRATRDAADGWRLVTFEGAVEEVTGYPASHFLGSAGAWAELTEPSDRADALERLRGYTSGALARSSTDHRIVRKDGSVRWVRTLAQVEPGRTAVTGVIHDVTEERRRELDLATSQERLRLAVLAGGHGLYDLDLRTGRAVVNDEYARMLGYDPTTFVETNPAWRERLHPDDRAAVYAEYEAYVAGKRETYRVEFRQRTADGAWRWVLSLGDIVERDGEGRPVRMVGTHTDIQALKDAEAALRESEDRFRRVVEASPVAMFIHARGCLVYLNPAALVLFGETSPQVLEGRPMVERFRPEDREIVAGRIRRLNELREPQPPQVLVIERPDGTRVSAELTGLPFRYLGVDGALVFARDVTERIRSESELRERLEELRRWQAVMLDREDRVQELKREVNELCRAVGQTPRYPSQPVAET